MEPFESLDAVLNAVAQGSTEFGRYEAQPPGVDDRGFFGNVPLIPVITWGSVSGVQLLLAGGADVNAVCEDGNTPLHHAIQMAEFPIARVLLAHGADPTIKNGEGKLPKELCWEGEWPSIFGVADA